MTGRMEGKVAVVTGGASGMGQSAALQMLAEGARVLIADINVTNTEQTMELAKDFGTNIAAFKVDVTEESEIEAMMAHAIKTFGRVDAIFNNAGVAGAMTHIIDTKVEDWDRTFNLVLRSIFLGIKHGAKAIRLHGEGGSIINTSSTAGLGGGSGPAAYSAAKAGIINLCKNAAVELAHDRIRVTAIAPGGIHTPMIPVPDDDTMKAFMKGRQPWPDTGYAEDIANGVLYLASDESRFVTGTTLTIDGGLLAWGPSLFPNTLATQPEAGFNMNNAAEKS